MAMILSDREYRKLKDLVNTLTYTLEEYEKRSSERIGKDPSCEDMTFKIEKLLRVKNKSFDKSFVMSVAQYIARGYKLTDAQKKSINKTYYAFCGKKKAKELLTKEESGINKE